MKPLLVDLETEWRGGQNQALLLLKGLHARGHAAELVAAHGSSLGQRAAASGIPVHYTSRGFFRFAAARRIRQLLRSEKFDLVHANEAHAVTAAWLAQLERAADRRVPLIISRRVGYPIGKNFLAQARYRSAARVVAISRWSAENAVRSGVPQAQISIVNEGVEIPALPTPEARAAARRHWGIGPETRLLGCVGALSPDKGQEYLIRALVAIREKFPDARLLLAGDGPSRSRLELLARELNVGDGVMFAGFVTQVAHVYAALDVFLLPSLFEALSNALMSAMAYGVPSIGFNCGGPAEIIEHGRSGLLVEKEDVPQLTASISALLADLGAAKALGAAGRQRIEQHFSADKMVAGVAQIYAQILTLPLTTS